MAYSLGEMQSTASNMFSAYASIAGSMMLYRSMVHDMIPEPVKNFFYNTLGQYIIHLVRRYFPQAETHMTIIVDEQSGISRNQIYDAAEIYLRPKINPKTERLKANKSHKHKSINISMEKEEQVIDSFNGFEVKWQFVLIQPDGEKSKLQYQPDKRFFELTFERKHKEAVVDEYLPFILERANEFKKNDREVKLYTRDSYLDNDDDDEGGNGGGTWGCVKLDHPVTFDKLAMDPKKKQEIMDDLDRFVRRKEYYKKVGKAWKRGYLLYGPPGTGKSTMIAAIANYLKFDVYDLELSSLYSNTELKRVLLCTNTRSILVIEDIDCSSQTHDRDAESVSDDVGADSKLTLSGLLNFMDGLWSTCGDERIVIFTTNHKEKLDPALLRPGRMDMHIHMGYCTPEGFDVLAGNYLGVHDHERLFPEIKQLIKEVDATPAEIAEHLMRSEDPELALEGVLRLLRQKKEAIEGAVVVAEEEVKEKGSEESEIVDSELKGKKSRKFGAFLKSLTRSRRRTSKETKNGEL